MSSTGPGFFSSSRQRVLHLADNAYLLLADENARNACASFSSVSTGANADTSIPTPCPSFAREAPKQIISTSRQAFVRFTPVARDEIAARSHEGPSSLKNRSPSAGNCPPQARVRHAARTVLVMFDQGFCRESATASGEVKGMVYPVGKPMRSWPMSSAAAKKVNSARTIGHLCRHTTTSLQRMDKHLFCS